MSIHNLELLSFLIFVSDVLLSLMLNESSKYSSKEKLRDAYIFLCLDNLVCIPEITVY